MFSIRSRFTYSNVVATLALVFAMSGGALAASKFLITSTKQIKPSVLASLKGKAGANGTAGAQGATGPAGPQGPAGAKGENGASGTNGEGVASANLTAGQEGCKEGGSKFTVGGKTTTACNGEKGKAGAQGPPGEPWTAGGTLPEGSTETGTWTISQTAKKGKEATEELGLTRPSTAISFPIPLAAPIAEANVKIFEGLNPTIPTGCTGTVVEEESVADLKAEPGNLCVWIRARKNITTSNLASFDPEAGVRGAGTHGAIFSVSIGVAEESFAEGTWAVTG